uniref:Ubiquitin-like protease family profile domain-containing protein n=1 Tax=Panagrolaimus superbus TaxID=310955 RepID=A0A914YYE2_9BILA
MASTQNEIITVDDDNADDARLDEVVNNAVQIPLTMYSLNKVINRQWIDDATVDSLIYKDVIEGHDDRLMVSAVVWNQSRIESWGHDRRTPNRLPTMPRYSQTFTKAVISVNNDNSHWSLAILDKNTKLCTYYCTIRSRIGPNLQKLKLICRLLCDGEECEVVEAPANSFLLQTDGYNCGPMICMLAYRILNNESLSFGTAEANAWRQEVYNYYRPFVANSTTVEQDSYLKIIDEDAKKFQSDATTNVKKGMKRKTEISDKSVIARKHAKIAESVKNDDENMILLSDEKVKLENEVKEDFISFCNRKKKENAKIRLHSISRLTEINRIVKEGFSSSNDFELESETIKTVQTVEDDSKEISIDFEKKIEKELTETFEQFCKRKKISKKTSKSKNLYLSAVQTVEQKMVLNIKQKEAKRISRANLSETQKAVENETTRERMKEHYETLGDAEKANKRNRAKLNARERRSALSQTEKLVESNKVKQAMRNHRNPQNLIAAGGKEIDDNLEAHYLGPMDQICSNENCKAKHFKAEKVQGKTTFYSCCQHGKTVLPKQKPYPEALKKLFDLRTNLLPNKYSFKKS